MLYETGFGLITTWQPQVDLAANANCIRVSKSDEWATVTLSPDLVAAFANGLHESRIGPVHRPLGMHAPAGPVSPGRPAAASMPGSSRCASAWAPGGDGSV